MASAPVFNIQRYSIHDGPGIRTTVFLKGCPLRCPWCSNPESQLAVLEPMYDQAGLRGLRLCVAHCPRQAAEAGPGGIRFRRELCLGCPRCVCPNGARQVAGEYMTAEEVGAVVARDAVFYRRSGGGVTLSGGEPLLYPDFARELLDFCRQLGVGTAVETTGCVPAESLEAVLPVLDTVLIDLKFADSRRHAAALGAGNAPVLESIRRLARWSGQLLVRIPVIPGWNDDGENLSASARFLRECGISSVTLLPYHRMGEGKYPKLDRSYALQVPPPSPERMEELLDVFRAAGLTALQG